MNNLLSCFGLVEVRINASKKDLPVKFQFFESHSVFFSDFRKDDKSRKKFIDRLHLTF